LSSEFGVGDERIGGTAILFHVTMTKFIEIESR